MSDTEPQTAGGKVLWHFTMSLDGDEDSSEPRWRRSRSLVEQGRAAWRPIPAGRGCQIGRATRIDRPTQVTVRRLPATCRFSPSAAAGTLTGDRCLRPPRRQP
jgi:hypothetical protein